MTAQEKVKCPRCGSEAKQFEILDIYKEHFGATGRYYCDRCGWLEDHDQRIPALIKQPQNKQAAKH